MASSIAEYAKRRGVRPTALRPGSDSVDQAGAQGQTRPSAAPAADPAPPADEPAAPTMIGMQTQLIAIRAQHNALVLRLRRREIINRDRYERALFNLAHRVRDQMLTASSRHAAILAADAGVAPTALARALDRIMRAALTDLSARHGSAASPQ